MRDLLLVVRALEVDDRWVDEGLGAVHAAVEAASPHEDDPESRDGLGLGPAAALAAAFDRLENEVAATRKRSLGKRPRIFAHGLRQRLVGSGHSWAGYGPASVSQRFSTSPLFETRVLSPFGAPWSTVCPESSSSWCDGEDCPRK